jgi:hypothetical protein
MLSLYQLPLTPVLPPPSRKEKQRRITNQDVLKLQAEVLHHHKEVLIMKNENIRLKKITQA